MTDIQFLESSVEVSTFILLHFNQQSMIAATVNTISSLQFPKYGEFNFSLIFTRPTTDVLPPQSIVVRLKAKFGTEFMRIYQLRRFF
jgi:hypothetical protein